VKVSPLPALVFDWDPPRRPQLTILSFLAFSAGLHALCFYLFQVVYPPTIALLPPPARVSLISSRTEEGRVILRWIEAEDPALASTTQRPKDSKTIALPAVRHVPSYLSTQPALKELPPADQNIIAPSAQPPAPVPIQPGPKPAAAAIAATTVHFGEEVEGLGKLEKPAMHFIASSKEPPQAARFRVGLMAQGEVRYCFLQESSGDAALDEQARKYLALCRFAPMQSASGEPLARIHEMIWSTATIEWGNDVAAPPAPISTPSPGTAPQSTP
jgi:hypothetical protein